MTCIVGLVHERRVWIGADSAGVAGLDLTVRTDPKVFTRDGLAFGFTSSFRMGQLLHHRLVIPARPTSPRDLARWMARDFIDAVRQTFKDGGFNETSNGADRGGQFLVGVSGRLFTVSSDYQVGERKEPYDACGCGEAFALGAFAGLLRERPKRIDPRAVVLAALTVAEGFSAGVRGPFRVVSV